MAGANPYEKAAHRKRDLRGLALRVQAVQRHIIQTETTPTQRASLRQAGYTTQTRLVRRRPNSGIAAFTYTEGPRRQTTMLYEAHGARKPVTLVGTTETVRHEIGHQLLTQMRLRTRTEQHRILGTLRARRAPLSALPVEVLRERLRSVRDQEPGGPIIRGLRGLPGIRKIDR